MKELKRKFVKFSFYDIQKFEKHLSDMAAEGWLIKKKGIFVCTYEKIQPQRLYFTVTYLSSVSQFDPDTSEKQLIKEELCSAAGWKLATSFGAMQIFYTENPNAVPIETDAVTQVKNRYEIIKKTIVIPCIFSIILYFIGLLSHLSSLRINPVQYLSSNQYLIFLFFVITLSMFTYELIFHLRWYKKAKQAAKNEGIYLPITRKDGKAYILPTLLIVLLLLPNPTSISLFIIFSIPINIGIISIVIKLIEWLKIRGISKKLNIIISTAACILVYISILFIAIYISMVFTNNSKAVGSYSIRDMIFNIYDDQMPLSVENLVDLDVKWSKKATIQESIMLRYSEYRQTSLLTESVNNYNLEYNIVDIKIPLLYDFVKEGILKSKQDEVYGSFIYTNHYEPIDPSAWNAQEVYQLNIEGKMQNTYLVCWQNRILELKFYWDPTPEQIKTAAEILTAKNTYT